MLLFPGQLSADWNRFRGPNGQGVAESDQPISPEISAEKNLKWRTELPGSGTSSPIVVGDRVYVTAYTGYGLDMKAPGEESKLLRHLLAFDRDSGEEVWRADVPSTGKILPFRGFVCQHGYASSTPTSDGEYVYVFFGSTGLIKFDRDGEEVWRTKLGNQTDPAGYGDGSSPIVWKNYVLVNASAVGRQLVAVDQATGEVVWSVEDESFTNTWSSPVIASTEQGDRVLFGVPGSIVAIDPSNGEQVWKADTPLRDAVCGSICVKEGVAYIMGGRAGNAIAIKMGGEGDVSETNTLWQTSLRSGICTPAIVGKNIYWCSGGIFYAADLATGSYVYKERLPRLGGPTGGFPNADYSSPIASGDSIVQFTRNGESYVIAAGDEFTTISHNAAFEDDETSFSSTPAISDGELFMRSEKYLYAIASPSSK